MQLDIPFYEGPEDALKAAVQAMGGAKKIGPLLWPDKSIDTAARLLLDCLNAGRSEKLDLSQTMMIFRMARDAGCYSPSFGSRMRSVSTRRRRRKPKKLTG
ncbi:hypothetical protein [Burkholderia pseudomallei]